MLPGFYLGLKFFGGSLRIPVNDCHTRYVHRFDTCIVCIQQGDGGGG